MYALSPSPALRGRHLLTMTDFAREEIATILRLASHFKGGRTNDSRQILRGLTLAMLFEKPSLRTRVSFEVAMTQLGGSVLFASGHEFSIGTRETPEDAARALSRYVDAIVVRTHDHAPLERFARSASVPVINGLSSAAHPCQALADMLTIQERFGEIAGRRIAFLGDARNNVAVSLAEAAILCGAHMSFGAPLSHRPSEAWLSALCERGRHTGGSARAFTNPVRAVREADVVYTDTWTSMGDEALVERNRAQPRPYAVTAELLTHAKPHAIFMHCLPAHRGEEVSSEVIDHRRSAVFDQTENRMHVQKALLAALLSDPRGIPT